MTKHKETELLLLHLKFKKKTKNDGDLRNLYIHLHFHLSIFATYTYGSYIMPTGNSQEDVVPEYISRMEKVPAPFLPPRSSYGVDGEPNPPAHIATRPH